MPQALLRKLRPPGVSSLAFPHLHLNVSLQSSILSPFSLVLNKRKRRPLPYPQQIHWPVFMPPLFFPRSSLVSLSPASFPFASKCVEFFHVQKTKLLSVVLFLFFSFLSFHPLPLRKSNSTFRLTKHPSPFCPHPASHHSPLVPLSSWL